MVMLDMVYLLWFSLRTPILPESALYGHHRATKDACEFEQRIYIPQQMQFWQGDFSASLCTLRHNITKKLNIAMAFTLQINKHCLIILNNAKVRGKEDFMVMP